MTLKNEYKQKTPLLREAEERAMPIYVLKSNTVPQMQTSLTSIFSLEIDPREAAMRETEDAIEVVLTSAEPVELSPQNAYIRRLQHQMAERANLVSRSRGREPYRRVRLVSGRRPECLALEAASGHIGAPQDGAGGALRRLRASLTHYRVALASVLARAFACARPAARKARRNPASRTWQTSPAMTTVPSAGSESSGGR